mmetsp:Transcript_38507/g.93171  ORF Transcript_38507/g.93171 Transcript_38507/m.93171 type:complete len:171 (+) Transcript_38507:50-562(+)
MVHIRDLQPKPFETIRHTAIFSKFHIKASSTIAMNSSIISIFMIICMILVSSVNAQGSHFYTLPDAEMAAREQQEGFRIKSSKKSAISNKDWMGTPVSRQQSKHSSNSSLRKNKRNKDMTFESVDTIGMDSIKDSIRNDRVSGGSRSVRSSVNSSTKQSSESQERTFDFS